MSTSALAPIQQFQGRLQGTEVLLHKAPKSTDINMVKAKIALTDLSRNEQKLRFLLLEVSNDIAKTTTKPQLRFTGGWVRDKLLGIPSDDIDVSITTMTGVEFANQVHEYLETGEGKSKYEEDTIGTMGKIEANPEMSKHLETATAKFWRSLQVDFVNTRTETYSQDSRTPQMQYGSPQEDAERRDATINALFYNLENEEVEDLTGRGIDDLKSGIIRTPLEPNRTFKDDPLRILRHIRFASRFDFQIANEDEAAMGNEAIGEALKTKITRERIFKEIEKTLKGPNPYKALKTIDKLGLYSVIFTDPSKDDLVSQHLETWSRSCSTLNKIIQSSSSAEPYSQLRRLLIDTSPEPSQAAYRAWLLCALVPWSSVCLAVNRRGRLQTQAAMVIQNGLKGAGNMMTTIAEDAARYREHIQHAKKEKNVVEAEYRVSQGTSIRKWGKWWRDSVMYALLVDVATFDPETHEVGGILEDYVHWLRQLEDLSLLDSAILRPLIDGNDIKEGLGCPVGGPWMQKATNMVIEWQFRNPEASTISGDCKTRIMAELRSRKDELRIP